MVPTKRIKQRRGKISKSWIVSAVGLDGEALAASRSLKAVANKADGLKGGKTIRDLYNPEYAVLDES